MVSKSSISTKRTNHLSTQTTEHKKYHEIIIGLKIQVMAYIVLYNNNIVTINELNTTKCSPYKLYSVSYNVTTWVLKYKTWVLEPVKGVGLLKRGILSSEAKRPFLCVRPKTCHPPLSGPLSCRWKTYKL